MQIEPQKLNITARSPQVKTSLKLSAIIVAAVTTCPSGTMAAGALASAREGQRTWGGVGYNATTYDEAQQRALARCSQQGAGCRVVAFFSRRCLAVAVQSGTGGSGWAVRATAEEAQEVVMNQCRSHGRPCELKLSVCDSVGLPGSEPPANAPIPPTPGPPSQPTPPPAQAPAPAPRPRGCDLFPELC
jgi:hypothetical protein